MPCLLSLSTQRVCPIGELEHRDDTAPREIHTPASAQIGTSRTVALVDAPDNEETPQRRLTGLHAQTPPWFPRAVIFVLVAYWVSRAFVSTAHALESLLVVVVMSFVIASALELPVNFLAKRMRRGFAAGIVIGGSLLALVALLVSTGALVVGQMSRLVHHAPATLARIVTMVNRDFGTHLHAKTITNSLRHIKLSHGSYSTLALHSATQIGSLLMGLLFTFYLAAEGPKFRASVCGLLSPRRQAQVLRGWEISIEKAGGYLLARGLLTGVRAVVAFTALMAMGIPDALALALWFGVLAEFIPVIGTSVATILPVLVALSVDPRDAVVLLAILLVINAVRNYVLAPKLSRRTVDLHPAVAFAGVIAAVTLFGPLAGLFVVPLLATAQAFFSTYFTRHEVTKHPLTKQDRNRGAPGDRMDDEPRDLNWSDADWDQGTPGDSDTQPVGD